MAIITPSEGLNIFINAGAENLYTNSIVSEGVKLVLPDVNVISFLKSTETDDSSSRTIGEHLARFQGRVHERMKEAIVS